MTLFVLFGFGHPVNGKADSMTPMDENELQSISGGDAIQLTLRLRNNVGEDNLPDTACGIGICGAGRELAGTEGFLRQPCH